MGNVKNFQEDLKQIFNSVQLSTGSHQKSALKLKNLYNLVDPTIFFVEFKKYTDAILVVNSNLKNPYVDRIMEFIALFCYNLKQTFDEASENNAIETEVVPEHPFLDKFFSYMLQRQDVINFSIRVRSCQLINKILDQLVGTDLSTVFCDQIEESMFERLNDPKLDVRLEGIKALHRFQEKHNPLDRIIDMFKILMEHDRFAKVRRLCTEKIALREDVISVILLKIRDVDIGVRLAAFTRLSKIPGALKIEQKRLILKCASLDKSDKIKTYIEMTLLPNWLLNFGNNFHSFMKAVRLDANESDVTETNVLCEFILKTLFKSKPLDELIQGAGVSGEDKLIPYENLNWETCNYWRILVQYIRKNEHFDDEIEYILPELVYFCNYIKRFCDNLPDVKSTTDFLKNQFILKQLFTITKGYDISDTSGRSALKNLIHTVLRDVVLTLDTVQVIISNLERIVPSIELRARYINELNTEISSPEDTDEMIQKEIEYNQKITTLKNDYNETSKRQEAAINIKDYTLAGNLEDKLKEFTTEIDVLVQERASQQSETAKRKQDMATLIKNLDIAAGLLLSPQVKKMTSSLETLKNNTIFELMIHENETVQAKAMHCYGLCCIIDKRTARDGIHIFSAPITAYQQGEECNIQILLTCIGSIVDLLRIYGTQLIAAPEEITDLSESQREDHQRHFFGGTSLTTIIQGLVDLMDDEQIQVQETAGRGLCSLVLSNTIQSASLLSRMVLKWCNPYDESQKLKQLIGVTLQRLPHVSGFHKQWETAIFITLKALIYAPDNSAYGQINIEDIAKFMLALYQVNLEDNGTMMNFAIKVCTEMRKKPKAKQVLMLSKVLNLLNFHDSDPLIGDLLDLCDELQDVVNNRLVSNNLIKFIGRLNQLKTNDPVSVKTGSDHNESGNDNDEEMEVDRPDQVSVIMEEDSNEE